MNILLTGESGQVGWEARRVLATLGTVIAPCREVMDLTRPDTIRSHVREHAPAVIVNTAAYTAVDQAEEEPELAQAINGDAPGILAEEAKRLGALLVHYSTDYVFDGGKPEPYTEADPPNPLNVYGRTKLAGERAIEAVGARHLILRTSWVYGSRGGNFLLTMLRLFKEREVLRIVADQIGAPTWCRNLAEATGQMLARCMATGAAAQAEGLSGIYHLTGGGQTNWFDFAQAIAERDPQKAKQRVASFEPLATDEFPTKAKRPANSRLDCGRIERDFGIVPVDWRHALELVMEELGERAGWFGTAVGIAKCS